MSGRPSHDWPVPFYPFTNGYRQVQQTEEGEHVSSGINRSARVGLKVGELGSHPVGTRSDTGLLYPVGTGLLF